jgi:membrane fusion protein (multidrug efflux system)
MVWVMGFVTSAQADNQNKIAVTVVEVQSSTPSQTHRLIGRVEPIESVALRARIEGFLQARLFAEGETVEAGQSLFQIEQAPYQTALNEAQAQLLQAKAQRQNADADFRRKQDMVRKDLISEAELDQAEAASVSAKAQVQLAQASVENAERQLGYTDIQSPIDGVIGLSHYTRGNLVNPASGTLASVHQLDPIYVSLEISERALLPFRRDLNLGKQSLQAALADSPQPQLTLSDGTQYDHSGRFTFLGNEVDPQTDSIKIRARFPNPDHHLLPGQFVTVMIEQTRDNPEIMVPQQAVQKDRNGAFVLVVNDQNQVEERRLTLGESFAHQWVVKSGLKEGERVITQGLQKVSPQQTVTPHLAEER